MSVPASGVLFRPRGSLPATLRQLRLLDLSPVHKITYTFDPLHETAEEIRYFMHFTSSPKVIGKAPNCIVKTNVVCDRSEPTINLQLIQPAADKLGVPKITIKAGNFSCLELLQLCNKHVTPLAVKPDKDDTFVTKKSKKLK